MASFRQRSSKWQARVKRDGFPDQVKTFDAKTDAERWARSVESEMDRGSFSSPTMAQKTSLGELIERYMLEVLPRMKGAKEDAIRLKALCRRAICKCSVAALTPAKIANFRDERLTEVAPGTVVRELAYLSSIINHGRREWGTFPANCATQRNKRWVASELRGWFCHAPDRAILTDKEPRDRIPKFSNFNKCGYEKILTINSVNVGTDGLRYNTVQPRTRSSRNSSTAMPQGGSFIGYILHIRCNVPGG